MTAQEVRVLLDDMFEEEAMIIGGLVALHSVDDTLVDRLFRGLAVVRDRALVRVAEPGTKPRRLREPRRGPHPSIERFLAEIGRA